MPRARQVPPGEDPTIDADIAWAMSWVKGEGDRLAKIGEYKPLAEFYTNWLPKLHARTVGDHWISRDRRLLVKEIERRTDRLMGVVIAVAQERGQLNQRGWTNHQLPKLRTLVGGADDQPMRIFATWPEQKFEHILDMARKARVMSRPALFRIEAGEPAGTRRKAHRYTIDDESTQRRVYTGAVTAMDGLATAVENLGELHPRITQGERDQWLEQLNRHRAKLTRAMHKLRTQPKPPSPPPSSTSR